jgi:hypothetical protein
MPPRRAPRIGEYRHTPASEAVMDRDGEVRYTRTRRRLRQRGLVVIGSGVMGTLLFAAAGLALRATAHGAWIPSTQSGRALPPAPCVENVAHGVGLPETLVGCALAGGLLWRALWRTKAPGAGAMAAFQALWAPGLLLGPVAMFGAYALALAGNYVRTVTSQPLLVRPLFSLIASPAVMVSALLTISIPLALVVQGAVAGLLAAAAVALAWQTAPEEPTGG